MSLFPGLGFDPRKNPSASGSRRCLAKGPSLSIHRHLRARITFSNCAPAQVPCVARRKVR